MVLLPTIKYSNNIKRDLPSNFMIHIHVYYLDVLEEIIETITPFSSSVFIAVTYGENIDIEILRDSLSKFTRIEFIKTENKGRDVLPFLKVLDKFYSDFDFFIHLHTKKSPHLDFGREWRIYLLNSLIGTKEILLQNLNAISKYEVGLVIPKVYEKFYSSGFTWGLNYKRAKSFFENINIKISNRFLVYPVGNMFIANKNVFNKVLKIDYDSYFEDENGQLDGTMAHIFERGVSVLARDAQYAILVHNFSKRSYSVYK